MKKRHVLGHTLRLSDLSWDDLYEDISSDWHAKAEQLQLRRWRRLKQQDI